MADIKELQVSFIFSTIGGRRARVENAENSGRFRDIFLIKTKWTIRFFLE
jgi:hypothetical protein